MNESVKKAGIKYGVIVAAIAIFYNTLAYVVDESLFVNFYIGIIIMIVNFVLLIMPVRDVKKLQDGFISFKEAFSAFTFTWIVAGTISFVYNLLLFQVIDPDLGARVQELIIEVQIDWMEKFNAPDEVIDEAIAQTAEKGNQYSFGNMIKGYFTGIIVAAIFGLIIAAFMKKNKPVFEETEDEE